jgi:hypothetical protein
VCFVVVVYVLNPITTYLLLSVALGGLLVAWLPLDRRFAGSNPAEDDEFLRVINVYSTTSFGRE